MRDELLIANQARRIAALEERLAVQDAALEKIRTTMICVGGPLNDNKLKFTGPQIEVFRRILEIIEGCE